MSASGPRPDADTYSRRRASILEVLAREDACLVLHGGDLVTRSNDTEFRFRPDSDFHFLTGLSEPGAVLVLNPAADHPFTLFVRPRDQKAETWSGRRVGPKGARDEYGANAAHGTSKVGAKLPGLVEGCAHVYSTLGRRPKFERRIFEAIHQLHRRNRNGTRPPRGILDAREIMAEPRLHKDAAALASLRRAVNISAEAHRMAMCSTRPGMAEYEIEATLESHFRRQGGSGAGYTSIVAGGDNATILHYVDNDATLRAGELLLIDAGAEWELHSGDITRTFPIDGTFNGTQTALYEVVLAANEAGIELARPGSTIDAIHEACVAVLAQGMHDLGLIDASVDNIIADKLYEEYYMHKTSHWLGIDVHDVGAYCVDGQPRALAEHMVLTVEPGLYIRADDSKVAPEFRGIGIRIEDDVLVTGGSPEVLSSAVPKTVNDIERLMAESPRLAT